MDFFHVHILYGSAEKQNVVISLETENSPDISISRNTGIISADNFRFPFFLYRTISFPSLSRTAERWFGTAQKWNHPKAYSYILTAGHIVVAAVVVSVIVVCCRSTRHRQLPGFHTPGGQHDSSLSHDRGFTLRSGSRRGGCCRRVRDRCLLS